MSRAIGDEADDGGEAGRPEGVDAAHLLEPAIAERLITETVPLLQKQEALTLDELSWRARRVGGLMAGRQRQDEAVLD